jgi:lysyl-tRNA synthetase, class I
MYQKPKSAKSLFFDVIPRAADEYLQFIAAFPTQEAKQKLDNPAWHLHAGNPPHAELPITFQLLLNLANVSNTEDKAVMWGFIRRYAADATPEKFPILDQLAGFAINYYRDFIKPKKIYRTATAEEAVALKALDTLLASAPAGATGATLQDLVYQAGKENGYTKETLRSWFQAIYEVLFGQSQGPRFGGFVELYGVAETRALIAKGLAGKLVG